MSNKKQPSKPVKVIRIGPLSVSIWERLHEDTTFYTVSCSRSYKDQEEWKYSDSFNRDDCLAVAKLFDLAHTWILRAEQEARKEKE